MSGINLLTSQENLLWVRRVGGRMVKLSLVLGVVVVCGWGLVFWGEYYWERRDRGVDRRLVELREAVAAYKDLEETASSFEQGLDLVGGLLGADRYLARKVFVEVVGAVKKVDGRLTGVDYEEGKLVVALEVDSAAGVEGLMEGLSGKLVEGSCRVVVWGPLARLKSGVYRQELVIDCQSGGGRVGEERSESGQK